MDLIPDYIRRKKGLTKIKYEHPLLKDVCADTFGIMIYQEQVQRAANVLAGYTLGPGRFTAPCDGQEGQGEDGEGTRQLHEAVARR